MVVVISPKSAAVVDPPAVILTVPAPETVSPVIIAAVLIRVLPLLIDNPFVLSWILFVPPSVSVLFPVITTADSLPGFGSLADAFKLVEEDRVIVTP